MYTILLLFSEQNTVWCSEMHSPRCLHQHVPGFILDPGVDLEKYRELPLHSSLCGSCSQVCPVKIDIADQIYKWRRAVAEKGLLKLSKKVSMNAVRKRPLLGEQRTEHLQQQAVLTLPFHSNVLGDSAKDSSNWFLLARGCYGHLVAIRCYLKLPLSARISASSLRLVGPSRPTLGSLPVY